MLRHRRLLKYAVVFYVKYACDSSIKRFAAGDCCSTEGVAIPIGIVHCGLRGSAVTFPEKSEVYMLFSNVIPSFASTM